MRTNVHVRVPASSANLGSAFDTAALALTLYNHVTIQRSEVERVTVRGQGANRIGQNDDNLVLRSAKTLFAHVGMPTPPLSITMRNSIPLGRGLGSSSAAIVAGLVGANVLLDEALTREELLSLAVHLEGHGDNVAAALYGGFTVYVAGGGVPSVPMPSSVTLHSVVFIPDQHVPTSQARAVLPDVVPRADAIFNVGRAALLVSAMSHGRLAALRIAMDDRLHQVYRSQLFPEGLLLRDAALRAGALGSAVSGAGPTILALAESTTAAMYIQKAFVSEAKLLSVPGRAMILDVDTKGVVVR